MTPNNAIYLATVTHKRLRPVRHALRYRVFNLLVDVDALSELDRGSHVFGYNRRRLISIRDRDHGPGDATPIAVHARQLAEQGGRSIGRIMMLCYPRVLGYVFNPLTVYYCLDRDGGLAVTIYEVSNTFGERHSYVVPVPRVGEASRARKRFFVSPFNRVRGRYSFHGPVPGETLGLGVALQDAEGPLLKAYVAGERRQFSDRNLLRAFTLLPFMTFKVIAAIHWEALKLRLKGLRPVKRPSPPGEVTVMR
jgi:DUF1365 family protein